MSVRISDEGAVRTVTIDRPECRNAVDPETAVALRQAFTEFEEDDSLAAAVLLRLQRRPP